jgi:ketosteroid isomerase-like protein
VTLDHGTAGDLLEHLGRAFASFDGDAWTDLFSPDAEYHEDPFAPPLVGGNALRAYLLRAAEERTQVETAVERHWVVPPTVLASWHASWVRRHDGARIRRAGFLTIEVGADGRITRLRQWWHERSTPAPSGQ